MGTVKAVTISTLQSQLFTLLQTGIDIGGDIPDIVGQLLVAAL